MAIVRRNSGHFPTWSNLFNDFLTRDFFDGGLPNFSATETTIPAVNIKETADNYEVELAAPGMSKDDFQITLDGNLLSIRSEKSTQNEEKEGDNYSRQEFSYESFQRSFQLPKDVVDEDQIQARYENGILLLTIPKREEAKQKPPKQITVA